jgi:hypothetical protein
VGIPAGTRRKDFFRVFTIPSQVIEYSVQQGPEKNDPKQTDFFCFESLFMRRIFYRRFVSRVSQATIPNFAASSVCRYKSTPEFNDNGKRK